MTADLRQQEALSLLAKIVNRASRAKPTSADEQFTCDVPLGLLIQAKIILGHYAGTEFGTTEVKAATSRAFK